MISRTRSMLVIRHNRAVLLYCISHFTLLDKYRLIQLPKERENYMQFSNLSCGCSWD
jgi:hypothetical protein